MTWAQVHRTNTDAIYDYSDIYIYVHKQGDKHTIIKVYVLVRDILGSDVVLDTAVLVVYQVTTKRSHADGEISLV